MLMLLDKNCFDFLISSADIITKGFLNAKPLNLSALSSPNIV